MLKDTHINDAVIPEAFTIAVAPLAPLELAFKHRDMADTLYSGDHSAQVCNAMLHGELTDRLAVHLAVTYDTLRGWWKNMRLDT